MQNNTHNKKNYIRYKEAQSGIDIFYAQAKQSKNFDELLQVANNLASYFKRYANDKNNRITKNVYVFTEFFKQEASKKRSVENVVNNAKVKRLSHKISYKDYLSDYLILRERGHSYQAIADYSEKYFKVKVNKETIRNFLKSNNSQEKGEKTKC